MIVLGIESSCDECAAAIVKDGREILSDVIATQIARHTPFQGVVPELASRLHTELIQTVVEKAVDDSGISKDEIDAVAVTCAPGLLGSLLVGVNFAKSYAYCLKKPIIGINHILAHLYASQIEKKLEYPYLGLLVSGGHTLICKVYSYDRIEVMGASVDDAVGEAFDKVAKYYNMGYPGGVIIDRLAAKGNPKAFSFPRPHLNSKYYRKFDMSFSGLKSAVINQKEIFLKKGEKITNENIAASFQRVAVRILTDKVCDALDETGYKRLALGGGVSANSLLRSRILALSKNGIDVALPSLRLCTDNAVMVAGLGCMYYADRKFGDISLSASSRIAQFKGYM